MTFENHCLEEEMPFSDSFEDSSVERSNPLNLSTLSHADHPSASCLLVDALRLNPLVQGFGSQVSSFGFWVSGFGCAGRG